MRDLDSIPNLNSGLEVDADFFGGHALELAIAS